ncbi:hypothetical protein PG987_002040 [Apiospora arundinis]
MGLASSRHRADSNSNSNSNARKEGRGTGIHLMRAKPRKTLYSMDVTTYQDPSLFTLNSGPLSTVLREHNIHFR